MGEGEDAQPAVHQARRVGDDDSRVHHEEPQMGRDYVRSRSLCL